MSHPLIFTKAARKAIRSMKAYSGTYPLIYTNKYKHCRTIKVYAPGGKAACDRFFDTVEAALLEAGSFNHSFKEVDRTSLIIRIPN